ncbi:MAG: ribonuclease HI [Spirochaetaceae bacterium]|nr:ribonuclease HI [Spirochaetaceae bacterium]
MAFDIYTDGGCSGNPGPGGWAYIMVKKTVQGDTVITEARGGEKNTTNNRMELRAVISALKTMEKLARSGQTIPRKAVVHTDSQYVQKGITEWIRVWKQNNWRTSDKKPVKNQDLWTELDTLAGRLALSWEWVKGHSGNHYNERCDAMTRQAIASL